MKEKHLDNFVKGLKNGIPIALGYFAVAFTLGIQAKNAGITAFQSAVASFGLHASAGEYIAFTLFGANATIFVMVMMEVVANARYLLMSCALSQKIPADTPIWKRLIMGYFITDEIFGASISVAGKLDPYYTFGLAAVASPAWCVGTALGVLMGNALPIRVVSALSVGLYGKSGLVKYSSLSLQSVLTNTKSFFLTNSSDTSEKTASCAAAWSALTRSIVIVRYLAPALPIPSLAGVLLFISR